MKQRTPLQQLVRGFLFILFASQMNAAMAQSPSVVSNSEKSRDKDAPPERVVGFDRSKLFGGGNFGLGFGNTFTVLNLSPQLGYQFNEHLAAGAGVNFIYNSTRAFGLNERFGYAGMNVFGRFYPIPYIVLHAQPEYNYSWGSFDDGSGRIRYPGRMVPSFLIGGGAVLPSGGRSAAVVMLLYDAVQDRRAPYPNRPFISFGYNFFFQ